MAIDALNILYASIMAAANDVTHKDAGLDNAAPRDAILKTTDEDNKTCNLEGTILKDAISTPESKPAKSSSRTENAPSNESSKDGTPKKVLEAVSKHNAIMPRLLEVQHAQIAITYEENRIRDYHRAGIVKVQELRRLRAIAREKRLKYKHISRSLIRRVAHKLTNQSKEFKSMVEKQKSEYLDALSKQQAAERNIKWFKDAIADAKRKIEELKPLKKEYLELKLELDNVFHEAFEDSGDVYPEEDQIKIAVKNNEDWYREARLQAEIDRAAYKSMKDARSAIQKAVEWCKAVQRFSFLDLLRPQPLTEIMDRDKIHRAQDSFEDAERLLTQACHLQKEIGPFANVVHVILSGYELEDIMFRDVNWFCSMSYRDRLDDLTTRMEALQAQVVSETQEQNRRVAASELTVIRARAALEEAVQELDQLRLGIFEGIAPRSYGPEPPGIDDDPPPPPPPPPPPLIPYSELFPDPRTESELGQEPQRRPISRVPSCAVS